MQKESVDLRFKPTPTPRLGFTLQSEDPLSSALANAPSLRVIRAQAPTVLNAFFTGLSSSSTLQRIELHDEFKAALKPLANDIRALLSGVANQPLVMQAQGDETQAPVTVNLSMTPKQMLRPNTLFRTQLQKHPKLQSLVHAGDAYLDNHPYQWRH